jgi:hypothetical protein
MRINEMTLSQPIYNPEKGTFEAQARLTEAGAIYTYRVHFTATPHADFDYVTRGLKTRALHVHRHARSRDMRLHRAPVPSPRHQPMSAAPARTGAELRRIGASIAA